MPGGQTEKFSPIDRLEDLKSSTKKLQENLQNHEKELKQKTAALETALYTRSDVINAFNAAKKSDKSLYFSTFMNRNILDSQSNFVKSALKVEYGKPTFSVNYKDSKGIPHSLKYNVDDFVSKDNKVNTTKLLISINNDIKRVEGGISTEKKQADILSGIETFDVNRLSKKAIAYAREKDYIGHWGSNNNLLDFQNGFGSGILFDAKGNLHFGKAFYIRKENVDSFYVNGKFDNNRFKNFLGSYLDREADKHFTAKAHKIATDLNKLTVTTSTISSAESKIKKAEKDMDEIRKLLVTIPAADKKVIDTKKNQLNIIKDYKEVSTNVNEYIGNLEEKANMQMTPVEMKKFKDEVNRIARLCQNKQYADKGRNVYNVYSKIKDGEKKYQQLVDRVNKLNGSI